LSATDTVQRVHKYGLLPPLEQGLIEEQARRGHRYRNVLIEIERGRRAALREAELSDPQAAGVAAAISWLDALAAQESAKIKAMRARTRSRSETAEMRERRDEARRLVKRAKLALRAYRAFYLRRHLRQKADKINSLAVVLKKSARAQCGVYWGTYLLHEAAMDASSKQPLWDRSSQPNDPGYIRWDGTAAWGVQIQGGITVDMLMSCVDRRLRIERLPAPPHMTGRRGKFRALLRIRIGSDGRAPIWGEWRMIMHRPLPEGAIVKRAVVHRRRDGRKWRWSVDLSITMPKPKPAPTASGSVGLDIGWRQKPDGSIRVAYWSGSDGQHGELALPAKDVEGYHENIRSVRDRNLDRLRDWLALRRQGSDTPEWFIEATKHMQKWRSAKRFARLCLQSRQHDTPGDIRLGLEWWRYRDIHLWDWETAQRGKTLRRRKDTYRRWAKTLASRYSALYLEEFDLRIFARKDDASAAAIPRGNRHTVAVSELRLAMQSAFSSVVEVDASNTTRQCHVCGHAESWDAAASIHHACTSCGAVWDQDRNAAIIIRERGLSGQTATSARKRKPPKAKKKWDRVKELKAEKKKRQEDLANHQLTS